MKTLTLKLHGTSPEHLNLKQLSSYLAKLYDLYGIEKGLHFEAVREGCACLDAVVEDSLAPAVVSRVRNASQGIGPKKYRTAYRNVTSLIERHGWEGEVLLEGDNVIAFPTRRKKPAYEPLRHTMQTTIKGRLYQVGGKDETVPVRLEEKDGRVVVAETTVELATELGKVLYNNLIVNGEADWESSASGMWILKKLRIQSFEVIGNETAGESLRRLRSVGKLKKDINKNTLHAEILADRGDQ